MGMFNAPPSNMFASHDMSDALNYATVPFDGSVTYTNSGDEEPGSLTWPNGETVTISVNSGMNDSTVIITTDTTDGTVWINDIVGGGTGELLKRPGFWDGSTMIPEPPSLREEIEELKKELDKLNKGKREKVEIIKTEELAEDERTEIVIEGEVEKPVIQRKQSDLGKIIARRKREAII
jgi:hypothetical protein